VGLTCGAILQNMRGVRRLEGERTAVYCAVYDGNGELVTAIADTAIISRLSSTIVRQQRVYLRDPCCISTVTSDTGYSSRLRSTSTTSKRASS